MPIQNTKGLEGLKGLKGLNALSDGDRYAKLNQYIDDGLLPKGATMEMADRLYRNRLFADMFGEEAFYQYTPEQRDALYKNTVINKVFYDNYNPFFEGTMNGQGPLGNAYDASKGLGNDFFKALSMSDDNKLELMESGYIPPAQLEKKLKENNRKENEGIQNMQKFVPGGYSSAALGALYSFKDDGANTIGDEIDLKRNQAIFDRIWAKDLAEKEEQLKPEIDNFYNEVFVKQKIEDEDVVKQFVNAINPPEGKGIPSILAAYFDAEGNSTQKETSKFEVDDMRRFLSRKAILEGALGEEAAHDALDNEAKKYLSKHQSTGKYLGLLGKDILISVGSYTADKWNMMRRLELAAEDKLMGDVDSFIDDKGNIYPVSKVNPRNGQYFYDDGNGHEIPVHKRKLSRIALDDAGLDSNGEKRGWFNDQQFWTNAEQFGTMDEDLQKQYKRIGYSPFKPVYEAGDETDIFYETAKMLSFGIADAGVSLLPVGGEVLATARGLNKTAKTLNFINNYVNPLAAAGGIGNAYGRGVYSESFEKNMQDLEQSLYDQSQKAVHDSYVDSPEYKEAFDADVEKAYQELKKKDQRSSRQSDGTFINLNSKGRDALLRDEAKRQIIADRANKWIEDFKRTDKYGKALEEAHESASSGAFTTAILDGSKYAYVNMYGYRKFLFKSGAARAAEKQRLAATKSVQEVTQNGKPRLQSKWNYGTKSARAWKATKIAGSQFWGGAWTNFTDEMQSTAGRQMSNDRMSMYLDGMYDTSAMDTNYTMIDALHSRLMGASKALIEENTWKAGLVGGLGSITTVLPTNISGMMNIKKPGMSLAKSWKSMSFAEKANAIISNGILNEYYSEKQGQAAVKARVEMMNELLDRSDDLQTIHNALAMNLADIDATNSEDKAAIKYVQGVQDIALLHDLQNDVNDADIMSKSSIVQKVMNTIEELSDVSKLSDKKKEEYLSQFYAANPSIAQSDAQNVAALGEMQDNARSLKESMETFREVQDKINKVESESGKKLSNTVRGNLLTRLTLDKFLTKRLDDNEREISGARVRDYSNIIPETYGTKKSREVKIKSLDKLLQSYKDNVVSIEKALEKAEKELQDFNESKEAIEDAKTGNTRRTLLENKVNILKGTLEINKESKYNISHTLNILKSSVEEGQEEKVLSSDEILNLNPVDRARMMNKDNRNSYSPEQQAEISSLEKKLLKIDSSLPDKVQDQGRMYMQYVSNEGALFNISRNPVLAGYAMEEAMSRHEAEVAAYQKQRYSDSWREWLNENLDNVNQGKFSIETLRQSVYQQLRKVQSPYVKYMVDSGEFTDFEEELNNAIDWSDNVMIPVYSSIGMAKYDEALSNEVSNSLEPLIDNSSSKEELLNNINDAIDNPSTPQNLIEPYKKIVSDLEQAWSLTSSRKEMTEEEKKKAEEEKNRQWLEQQKAQAEAEEKARLEAERKAAEEALKPQVTDKDTDTSNDKVAELAVEGLDAKDLDDSKSDAERRAAEAEMYGLTDKDDNGIELSTEDLEKIKNGETIDFDSPDAEEELSKPSTTVVDTNLNQYDDTVDGVHEIQGNQDDSLLGNTFYRYDSDLAKQGIESPRKGKEPNDPMNNLFNWLQENGINMQAIIDDELYDISTLNPDVHIISVNPKTDQRVQKQKFLAVEYTKDVSSIHNKDNGGVVEANGKKYLIIGTLGYDPHNSTQQGTAFKISDNVLRERNGYFQNNPSERFYVDSRYSTKIRSIGRGRLLNQTSADSEKVDRPITELVNDKARNPKGYKLTELPWVISYNTKPVGVNITDSDNPRFPRGFVAEAGSVYVMIPASDSSLLPAYIKPVTLSKLKDSRLKSKIDDLIMQLASPNLNDRLKAKKALRFYFPLSKDGDNILVGTEDKATITTIKNGVKRTVDLKTANSNQDIVDLIYNFDPRINITTSVLKDSAQMELYSEAGVLNTDRAKLGTSNASFSVYSMDVVTGKPVGEGIISDFTYRNGSDLASYGTPEVEVQLGTEKCSLINGIWRDSFGNKITRQDVIEALNLHKLIKDKVPDRIKGNNEVFIINPDRNNPVIIVKRVNSSNIVLLSKDKAIAQLDIISGEAEKKAMEDRVKKELERGKKQDEILNSLTEEEKRKIAEEGETIFDDDMTADEIAAQLEGIFIPPGSKVVDSPVRTPSARIDSSIEISSKILTDTENVELKTAKELGISISKETDDVTFYVDSKGKIYPRATSVLAADIRGKRMPKDSLWILPSTTIGTGLHNFVEDVIFNRAGDSSTYAERYPNATNEDLQNLAAEARKIKAELEKDYDIVGTELTITGEIEVIKENGEKGVLPVAGTIDILGRNKTTGQFKLFDFKTKRGYITAEDELKWALQQTLYGKLLEQKYGAVIEGYSIMPFKINDERTEDKRYPEPSSTNKYTAKNGQLQLNGKDYTVSFVKLPNKSLTEQALNIMYDKLTPIEQLMVRFPSDVTKATGKKESIVTQEAPKPTVNVNEVTQSLAELQNRKEVTSGNLSELLRKNANIRDAVKRKFGDALPKKMDKVVEFLASKGLNTTNIDDINQWIKNLEECH